MWYTAEEVDQGMAQFHNSLAGHLRSLTWNRVGIWEGRVSVHAWPITTGNTFAFDALKDSDTWRLQLLPRDPENASALIKAARLHGIGERVVAKRAGRISLMEVPDEAGLTEAEVAALFAKKIRRARLVLTLALAGEVRQIAA